MQPLVGPAPRPADLDEITFGAPAVRFAKTLQTKMDRRYWEMSHVVDQPFAIAIADFHLPGSMTWSPASLQSYLYGRRIVVEQENGFRRARSEVVDRLRGAQHIQSGFFRQSNAGHVSAVIASNGATLAKFNRMGFLAGWKPPGLKMERSGIFFDHSGDRMQPKEFCVDLDDPAYQQLWPFGECWCLELEVYHNPQALHPISREFFPGATHFFERDGDIVFESPWENRVLASATHLRQGVPADCGALRPGTTPS